VCIATSNQNESNGNRKVNVILFIMMSTESLLQNVIYNNQNRIQVVHDDILQASTFKT
jgi:hypothetical protein